MSRSLYWLRTDLRVHDNRALAASSADGDVIALYVATPAQWDAHDDAAIKRDFWRRNLALLEQALSERGIPLLYAEVPTYADLVPLLRELIATLEVSSVHCNREYPLNERRRDKALAAECNSLGVRFIAHEDQVLIPPKQLLNKSGSPFKVFTPFSRTARLYLEQVPPVAADSVRAQMRPALQAHAALKSIDQLTWPPAQPDWAQCWPAGELQARDKLEVFCRERMPDYKERRDLPAQSGTSQLSHYLSAGVLSVRECWRESLAWGESGGGAVWQSELLWRDFYKHVMWHFPHVCQHLSWRTDVAHVPWRHDHAEFALWCEGKTGIPIIDAAMRQLVRTGWMHNRLRMLTAAFLSKHLLIDWRWGERFFMQHLIDGDFSANNGGWQWSASTGTDASPYFRIFNPVTQSRRFDADGAFIRQFVPELAHLDAHAIHEPGMLRPASYPAPMIELAFGRERALNAFKG